MLAKTWFAAAAALALLVASSVAVQAAPPPPGTTMEYAASTGLPGIAAPADGQVGSWTTDCFEGPNEPQRIVVDFSTRFYVGAYPPEPSQVRPEFGFASRLEVNNPNNLTIYWRNNAPGGEDGFVEIVVHCALYR